MPQNWTNVTAYPTPLRGSWNFAIDNSDRLYIIAGWDDATFAGISRVDRYDPATDTWGTAAALPSPLRDSASVAVDTQGRIYIIAGAVAGEATDIRDVDRYDPATNTWTARANLPVDKTNAAAVSDSLDRIYVSGGWAASQTKTVYRYDPGTNAWSKLPDMPLTRDSHAMAVDDQDRVYVIGGWGASNRIRQVDRYDPATNAWTTIAQLPTPPRSGMGPGTDRFGRIYSIGGTDNNADSISQVARYDPFLAAWATLDPITAFASTLSGSARSGVDSQERIWANAYIDGRNIWRGDANDPPNAPTLDHPTQNEVINTDVSNRFEWTFNDPDPEDTQAQYELRYRIVGAATWTTVSAASANTFHDFAAATFAAGDYEWQVRTQDSLNTQGPWSASEFFTVDSTPATPTINDPVLDQVIGTNTYEVAWSSTEQDAYQLRKMADDGLGAPTTEVLYDSGTQVSTSTIHETPFPVNGRTEHIQVRVRENTIWSAWDSVRISVDYTTPAEPTITLTPKSDEGHILIEVDHPVPTGNEPNVTSQDLLRRETGTTAWTVLAAGQAPETSYTDYTVVSEQAYEYAVISYGDNDTNATSAPESTSGIVLAGSWVHRISDPAGTARQFRYNTTGGADQWTPDVTFSQFAGRRLPVAEFGEFDTELVAAELQLDGSAEVDAYLSIIKSKETLCYRDAARRKVFGIATGLTRQHTFYGASAPLEIQAIDYNEDVS